MNASTYLKSLRILSALCLAVIVFSSGVSTQAKPSHAGSVPSIQAFEQVTARAGWILFDQKLYWTSNNGASWTDISPAADILSVDFIDASRGRAAVSASSGISLASTADGGRSWNTRALTLPAFHQADAPIAKVFMTWRTESHGWIVFKLASGTNFSRGMLFVTFDGGKNWLSRELPIGEPVTFSDNVNGWVAGGPDGSQFFRTRDGGQSWESAPESRGPREVQNDAGWKLSESGGCAGAVCTRTIQLLTRDEIPMRLPNGQNALRENFSNQKNLMPLADPDTSVFIGQGFDTCEIPSLAKMQAWWDGSPYGAANLYIGGVSRACANAALTSSTLTQMNAQGWKFIPTWVGLQASCSVYPNRMSSNAATAYDQGVAEADSAIAAAQALGLTNADGSGTIIYFDLEHYSESNTACRNAANAFINGWTFQMRARGNLAGVYGSPCNAIDWAGIANVPDAVWLAHWVEDAYTPTASVYGTVCLGDSYWNNHRRLRQYAGGHNETWGGQTINIDSDVLDGTVAVPNGAGGGSAPTMPSNPNPANGSTLARTSDTTLAWNTNGASCSIHVWGGALDITAPTSCTSYQLGVQDAGAYSWQVTATNGFGSTVGPTWTFNIQPAAPTGLSAAAASPSRVNLTWTASADAVDNYLIFVDGAQAASVSGSATSYQVQNLACKSAHSFYVKAALAGVQSDASATVNATTLTCTPTLISPVGGVVNNLQPTFAWQAVNEATAYRIQVSANSTYTSLAVNTQIAATTYTPTQPLLINKKYYWRVRAVGPFGNGNWAKSTFTTPNPPPAPMLTAPANNALTTDLTPLFNWNDVIPPSGTTIGSYQIQTAKDTLFANLVHDATVGPSQYAPTIKFQWNRVYYWRVRAVNTLGHAGAWSATRSLRTVIRPPTLVSPANGAVLLHRRPTFDWRDAAGANGYTVQVSTSSAFIALLVNAAVTPSTFTLPVDLPANKLLYWRVRAEGFNGPSLWSVTRRFRTGNPPSIPAPISPANAATIDDLTPRLTWRASTVPAGTTFHHYQIQVATNVNFASLILDGSAAALTPSEYTLTTPLLANKKYYWRVRAFNIKGEYSAWSIIWNFRTSATAVFEWMNLWRFL